MNSNATVRLMHYCTIDFGHLYRYILLSCNLYHAIDRCEFEIEYKDVSHEINSSKMIRTRAKSKPT